MPETDQSLQRNENAEALVIGTPDIDDPEIRMEFGDATMKYDVAAVLLDARTQRGLTREALACIAQVTPAYIARLERGEANPSLGRVGAILAVMGFRLQLSLVPLQAEEGSR